jgi:uncharacterized protein
MRRLRRTVPAPEGLGTEVIGVPSGADVELDLRLEAVMEGVLVTGEVRGTAVGECVRCLGDVRVDLGVELDVTLMELFAYPGRTPEGEGDDDVRELEDDLIDLESALRDAVVTALPFQPVCSGDCPGLCSECGARLADDPEHRHESADPRWAALQGIVLDDERRQDG